MTVMGTARNGYRVTLCRPDSETLGRFGQQGLAPLRNLLPRRQSSPSPVRPSSPFNHLLPQLHLSSGNPISTPSELPYHNVQERSAAIQPLRGCRLRHWQAGFGEYPGNPLHNPRPRACIEKSITYNHTTTAKPASMALIIASAGLQ